MARGLSCDQVRAAAAPSRLSDAWKLPLPTLLASSVTLFVVGPVPGLGAGSAGGSQWGLGEGEAGRRAGSLPSLAEAGHWGPAVWLGFGSKPAILGGCE